MLELTCGGYEISILFDFNNTIDDHVTRFRRPLLTEEERARMSESLIPVYRHIEPS